MVSRIKVMQDRSGADDVELGLTSASLGCLQDLLELLQVQRRSPIWRSLAKRSRSLSIPANGEV